MFKILSFCGSIESWKTHKFDEYFEKLKMRNVSVFRLKGRCNVSVRKDVRFIFTFLSPIQAERKRLVEHETSFYEDNESVHDCEDVK